MEEFIKIDQAAIEGIVTGVFLECPMAQPPFPTLQYKSAAAAKAEAELEMQMQSLWTELAGIGTPPHRSRKERRKDARRTVAKPPQPKPPMMMVQQLKKQRACAKSA